MSSQQHVIKSVIRQALENMKVASHIRGTMPIVDVAINAIEGKAGYIKRNDWNASLTFKTASNLKAGGIL